MIRDDYRSAMAQRTLHTTRLHASMKLSLTLSSLRLHMYSRSVNGLTRNGEIDVFPLEPASELRP